MQWFCHIADFRVQGTRKFWLKLIWPSPYCSLCQQIHEEILCWLLGHGIWCLDVSWPSSGLSWNWSVPTSPGRSTRPQDVGSWAIFVVIENGDPMDCWESLHSAFSYWTLLLSCQDHMEHVPSSEVFLLPDSQVRWEIWANFMHLWNKMSRFEMQVRRI